ncbi:MAG: NHL repeat-containing protein [Candidatus Acidiferrales bacterium]
MAAGLSGTANVGTQPLANATIRLWQVGTAGYGTLGTLAGSTTSGPGGHWTISTINCNPANIDVYVIARSRDGEGPVRILAFLGPCNALPSDVVINEVTSVAAIWALQRFMLIGNGAIGAPASNATGLANAGLNALNLADVTTGTTPGSALPAGATTPTDEINTLADIMASCDVTPNPPLSAACTSLFTASLVPGQGGSSDSLKAMLYIALFPVNNVSGLFALAGASPPFTPTLSAAPTDWSIVVNYVNGGLNTPAQLAIDASGNVWVANALGNSLSEFNAAGMPLSASGFSGGGLNLPVAVAINSLGDVWVANQGANSLSEFGPDGTVISPVGGFTGGGLELTQFMAIDSTNKVWVANCADFCDSSGVASNLSVFSPAGVALTPTTGILGGGLNGATGIALDQTGNVWVANQGNNSLSEFNALGMPLSPSTGFTGGGLFGPVYVAVSSKNFIWAADQRGNSLTAFADNGSPVTGNAGFSGGGINAPLGVALDGSRNKWTTNVAGVGELNATNDVVSPTNGFVDPNSNAPFSLAIDASGNIWVTNTGGNSLSQFLGLAAPVKTPLIGLPTLP